MEKTEILVDNGLKIYQDDSLYTFTSDSILLSKFTKVKKGDVVADFCAGSGIVGFNLYALNSALIKSVTFFEMQSSLFELCKKSIELNDLKDKCYAQNTKLQDIDKIYNEKFSLIVCNPPSMKIDQGEVNKKDDIAMCRNEIFLQLPELWATTPSSFYRH